jgi:hypothetical protein
MKTKRARILLGTIVAAMTISLVPASSTASPKMVCAPDFEAVCYAIAAACHAADSVEAKILKKDLINCQLG